MRKKTKANKSAVVRLDKLGTAIWKHLTAQGASEDGIMRDFERFKKRRNRRV